VKVEEILTVENSFPGRYFSMTASKALCLLSWGVICVLLMFGV